MFFEFFGVDFDLSSQVHSGLCTKKLSQKMPKRTKLSQRREQRENLFSLCRAATESLIRKQQD